MTDSLPVVSRLHEDQGAAPEPNQDGYDYLRLRVVDPDLPFNDQASRLLDKLFLEHAALRASLGERDATIAALRKEVSELHDEVLGLQISNGLLGGDAE